MPLITDTTTIALNDYSGRPHTTSAAVIRARMLTFGLWHGPGTASTYPSLIPSGGTSVTLLRVGGISVTLTRSGRKA